MEAPASLPAGLAGGRGHRGSFGNTRAAAAAAHFVLGSASLLHYEWGTGDPPKVA